MFIIYVAHCRGNFLYDWIPARFGISDAANLFVFVSGMTVAIAFGGTFARQGWLIGTARIAYRCMQLYAAQVGLFCATAAVVVIGTHWYGDVDYVAVAEFERFFTDPGNTLVGLLTLTYVPHSIDILPLYIVALAMVPIALSLARVHPWLAIAASIALYAAANLWQINFPANADNQPDWYFNPFAWQLIFFTGFALGRRWITVPLASRVLFWASVVILVAGLTISLPFVFERVPPIDWLRLWIYRHTNKTYLDLLQYVHFLASAYVAVALLRGREQVLLISILRPVVKCGQQALSIFTTGIVLSYVGGMVFDHAGTGLLAQVAVNGITFAVLIGIAYGVAWFKNAPWKRGATAVTAALLFSVILGTAGTAYAEPDEVHKIPWQGIERGYRLHVPPAANSGSGPLPLVIALHGAGGTAAGFAEETKFAAPADANVMLVAFPEGTVGTNGRATFNAVICCGEAAAHGIDDIGFVDAVIEDIAKTRPLDRRRIYAAGMSNGGMLVHQLAARHPERFAAIAPVAATIGGLTADGRSYLIPAPEIPVPVMILHGMRDRLVLYKGGASADLPLPNRWKISGPESASFWAAVNHCNPTPETTEIRPGSVQVTSYTGCAKGSAVRLVSLLEGGHEWPSDVFPEKAAFQSAAAEIVSFFTGFQR